MEKGAVNLTETIKLYGVPGTGKTHRAIQEFKQEHFGGTHYNNIMYNTYRKNATRDGKQRVAKEIGVAVNRLHYVRSWNEIT